MRRGQGGGLGYVTTALIALAIIVAGTYLAFTKEIPFQSHYEVDAVVQTGNQIQPGAYVRIAGVDVGEVRKVELVGRGERAARITMRLRDDARPIHKDATLKIRPRTFFEGNFFIDLQPGTPHAPELGDGETIPINQTAGPVQFDQVLGILRRDTRDDLKSLLHELNQAWSGGGAQALNRTMRHWEPAYRDSAIVNDAMQGINRGDLNGYIRTSARVAEGLSRNGEQLQSLVTDLRTTAGAFAARDTQLEAALAELPRTLRAGRPALAALNDALPSLRRFTADLRPGVRSSPAALDAQVPLVRQLRGLVSNREARGLAADLRPTVPALARLNRATLPLLEEVRAASSCQNEVVMPWTQDKIEDPVFPAIGPVYQEQTKPLVGLAGESRTFDANGQWFRVQLNSSQFATPVNGDRVMLTDRPIQGVNPPKPPQRPPLRAHIPCETQEPPDLRTPNTRPPQSFRVREAPAEAQTEARAKAVKWLEGEYEKLGRNVKVVDELLQSGDIGKLKLPQTPPVPGAGG